MTPDQARTLVINADENVLQGWLDLQRVWFDNRNDPDMLKAGIADWQKRYPQNPGAKMLPTQLVNVQRFKPASTSKIALLLPLNGQAAVFGRTIQQGFEAAKNLGTQAVEMQPAAAPDAPVEPGVEETQPQMTNGVASPSQASVSDLTDDAPAQSATPVSAPQTPPATASAPADPSAELKTLRYLFPAVGSGACSGSARRRQYRGRAAVEKQCGSADEKQHAAQRAGAQPAGNGT